MDMVIIKKLFTSEKSFGSVSQVEGNSNLSTNANKDNYH